MSVLPAPMKTRKRHPLQIQRAVLLALFIRELRTRVEGRWVGALWLLMEPLAHVMFILYLFSFLRRTTSSSVEFPVFLVTGLLPFFIFRNVTLRLTDAIAANRSLFAYRQVKPIDALVARALVEVGLYSAVYLAALAILGWLGYHWLPWAPLELMLVSLILLLLASSLGLFFAVATNGRPKARAVIGLLFLPLYVGSGVIFSVQAAPPDIRELLLYNPMLHLIELSRAYFVPGYQPLVGANVFYPSAIAAITSAIGMSLYRISRQSLIITP